MQSEACIFGEGPYERRDRLRTIMAGRREARRLQVSRGGWPGGEVYSYYSKGFSNVFGDHLVAGKWTS